MKKQSGGKQELRQLSENGDSRLTDKKEGVECERDKVKETPPRFINKNKASDDLKKTYSMAAIVANNVC